MRPHDADTASDMSVKEQRAREIVHSTAGGRALAYAEYGDPAGTPILEFQGLPNPRQAESLFSIGPLSNRLLVAAVAVEALTLLAFVYVPPIQAALGQYPLSATQWLPVLITPWILLAAEEARKAVVRRRAPAHHR
jgi:hypothetical protein